MKKCFLLCLLLVLVIGCSTLPTPSSRLSTYRVQTSTSGYCVLVTQGSMVYTYYTPWWPLGKPFLVDVSPVRTAETIQDSNE